jgi:hypothetical protein
VRTGLWIVGSALAGLGAGLWIGTRSMAGIALAAAGAALVLIAAIAWRRALAAARGSSASGEATSGGDDDDDGPPLEPRRIEDLPLQRRNELIRGTSMQLRDMKYRYSIRYDHSDRAAFTTDVNGVTLGFVPVIILDNRSDKQGYGYVAFPYDGSRWRGPGLPCGGDPQQAVAHAAKCVAPLEES